MFKAINFILDNEIMINPIHSRIEKKNGGNRLYIQAQEKARRREEEKKRQLIFQRFLDAMEMQDAPNLGNRSKSNFKEKRIASKDFYDYNLQWMRDKENRIQQQHEQKEELFKEKLLLDKARLNIIPHDRRIGRDELEDITNRLYLNQNPKRIIRDEQKTNCSTYFLNKASFPS